MTGLATRVERLEREAFGGTVVIRAREGHGPPPGSIRETEGSPAWLTVAAEHAEDPMGGLSDRQRRYLADRPNARVVIICEVDEDI